MPSIWELKPFLDGLAWRQYKFGYPHQGDILVKGAAQRMAVEETDIKGWIKYMVFGGTDPYITADVTIDDYREENVNPFNLNLAGYTAQNNFAWWCNISSALLGYYACTYSPADGFPVKKVFKLGIRLGNDAGAAASATLLASRVDMLVVTDLEALKGSLEKLGIEPRKIIP